MHIPYSRVISILPSHPFNSFIIHFICPYAIFTEYFVTIINYGKDRIFYLYSLSNLSLCRLLSDIYYFPSFFLPIFNSFVCFLSNCIPGAKENACSIVGDKQVSVE